MRKALLATVASIGLVASAYANTWTVEGYVVNPTRPNASGIYGYDNGGYFGSQFASLGGLPFTIDWTGSGQCNCYGGPMVTGNSPSPITGALLTIGNVTVDLLAYGGLLEGEWLSNVLQVETMWSLASPFPSTTTFFGSRNVLTTWSTNDDLDKTVGGSFILSDIDHQYATSAYLLITNWNGAFVLGVPGVVVGAGIPGLLFLAGAWFIWQRRRTTNG